MNKFILFVSFLLTACQPIAFQPYWRDEVPPVDTASAPFSNPANATSVPQKTDTWQTYTVVGTVNIRSEPSTSSSAIGWLLPGAKVRADCDRLDGFCQVVGGYIVSGCLGVGNNGCSSK